MDRKVFERNVRIRLAVIGATISDVARSHGVSRAAVDKRFLRQRLSEALLQWWAEALAIPVDMLALGHPSEVAGYPVTDELRSSLGVGR